MNSNSLGETVKGLRFSLLAQGPFENWAGRAMFFIAVLLLSVSGVLLIEKNIGAEPLSLSGDDGGTHVQAPQSPTKEKDNVEVEAETDKEGGSDAPSDESKKEKEQVERRIVSSLTAYNSEASQCDSSPCITANGYNVCEGDGATVAANHLPFGTKVRIPEYFGDKVFVVRDRMNSRYSNRIDVWMESKQEAIQFGVKRSAEVEILE